MELKDILAKCDHTLLTQTATWAEIKGVCDDGMKYHTASVCIPASYVKQAKEYVGDKLPICTVIGFPNGYDTTAAKCFEAEDAVKNGRDITSHTFNVDELSHRVMVADIDTGEEIQSRIDDLMKLLEAFRDGIIKVDQAKAKQR